MSTCIGEEFAILEALYTAIEDLDQIINSNSDGSDNKISEAINAITIRDLEKELSSSKQSEIVSSIREALADIYLDKINLLNDSIKLKGINNNHTTRMVEGDTNNGSI